MCSNNIQKELFECCIVMVEILLKQYKNSSIDISDFRSHSLNKIKYIMENIDFETDIDKKNSIINLIDECNKITSIN